MLWRLWQANNSARWWLGDLASLSQQRSDLPGTTYRVTVPISGRRYVLISASRYVVISDSR